MELKLMDDLPTEHPALVALRDLDDEIGRDIADLCKTIAELECRLKYAQSVHQRVKEAIDLSVPVEPCPPRAAPDFGYRIMEHVLIDLSGLPVEQRHGAPEKFEGRVMSNDGIAYRIQSKGCEYRVNPDYVHPLPAHGYCPDCGSKCFIENETVAFCGACTTWMREKRPQVAKQVSWKPEQLVDAPEKAKLLQLPQGPPWPHYWTCPHCRGQVARRFIAEKGYYGCAACNWKTSAGVFTDEQLPEPQF